MLKTLTARRRRRRGLASEVKYWRDWIATRGEPWPWDFSRRFDATSPLQERLILERLDTLEDGVVSILDVGAGPASSLGTMHPEKQIVLTAVDPLASEYAVLLEEAGLEAPVPTLPVAGERLRAEFGPASFDFVYARNSLDHAADPALVVEQMLEVVRPGGFVILRHYESEGEAGSYRNLEQWNFRVVDGRLHIWSRRSDIDLNAHVAASATCEASVETDPDVPVWVTAVLRRRAER